MKSIVIAGFATLALGAASASAQNASPSPEASASTSSNGTFVYKQTPGEFRAPKMIGVAVYDRDNKSVGKVSDLMLDKDGKVKAVVVSIGGFLGIGSRYVALPYSALHWQTEQRTAAVGEAPANPAGGVASNAARPANGASDATMGANPSGTSGAAPAGTSGAAPAGVKIDPAKTEAYQGYPDRAVVEMSQAELKSAPEFKYASNPDAETGSVTGNTSRMGTTDTTKP